MTDWRARAVCARLDPADVDRVFHGTLNVSGDPRYHPDDVAEARALCDACPVQWECLADVLAVPGRYDRHGIRAGLRPAERAMLRDEQAADHRSEVMERWTGMVPERRAARLRADGVLSPAKERRPLR